jgi:hypothetical protein
MKLWWVIIQEESVVVGLFHHTFLSYYVATWQLFRKLRSRFATFEGATYADRHPDRSGPPGGYNFYQIQRGTKLSVLGHFTGFSVNGKKYQKLSLKGA